MDSASSDSSDDETILDYVMWRRQQTKDRVIWVREIFLRREQEGEFHVLVPQLIKDPAKFQNYFRMTKECFNLLVSKVKPVFSIGQTNYRKSIGLVERLTVTIRFLANCESYASASYRFRISANHLCKIIPDMLQLIYTALQEDYLKFPKKEDWIKIAESYENKKYFPNCIGALDGKHIRIKKPSSCGSLFYNYKKYHSIVLLSLVDVNCTFLMIDVGSYGRDSDGGILKHSEFGKQLANGTLDIPSGRSLEVNGEIVPYVVIAFQLTKNLMKPYPQRQLDRSKRIFNYRLSFARSIVECTFGILVSKFRIFETPIAVAPENVDKIIKSACVLHNMIRIVDNTELRDREGDLKGSNAFNNLAEVSAGTRLNQSTRYARHVRELFTNYFSGSGATYFQDAVIEARDAQEIE